MRSLLVGAMLVGCSTLGGLTRLDEMDDAQADRLAARLAGQVGAVAQAAVAQGDVDAATLASLAGGLRGLADGTVAYAGGGLAQALEVDGYGAAGLAIAIGEIDAALEERGAWEGDGAMGPRTGAVLRAVADALERAGAGAEAEPEGP